MRQVGPKPRFSNYFRTSNLKSCKYTIVSLLSKGWIHQTFVAQKFWKSHTPSFVWTFLVPESETQRNFLLQCLWVIQVTSLQSLSPWSSRERQISPLDVPVPRGVSTWCRRASIRPRLKKSCSELCKLMFRNLPFILTNCGCRPDTQRFLKGTVEPYLLCSAEEKKKSVADFPLAGKLRPYASPAGLHP